MKIDLTVLNATLYQEQARIAANKRKLEEQDKQTRAAQGSSLQQALGYLGVVLDPTPSDDRVWFEWAGVDVCVGIVPDSFRRWELRKWNKETKSYEPTGKHGVEFKLWLSTQTNSAPGEGNYRSGDTRVVHIHSEEEVDWTGARLDFADKLNQCASAALSRLEVRTPAQSEAVRSLSHQEELAKRLFDIVREIAQDAMTHDYDF